MSKCNIRTGFGFDVHKLVENRELWLCGIKIPHSHGLLGHSDADVAIHALCDALLGALSLRDIGYHFPDTDPAYKGADSKILLSHVCKLIREKGWEIGNADITICAEAPKINPHIEKMQTTLAEVCQVAFDDISIKATTTEKLGFTGRREGISAYAVVLIYKP
jgi:2-C-methyl-D-erythritol 2,4-cyclodiphosphate synthase